VAIATRQLGNEAQSPIAGQQPPIVGLQAATVNRQSTCRAAKFVRRHVAIVIAAHNHFPAHYDFIDRSKKSAEVRMSERSQLRLAPPAPQNVNGSMPLGVSTAKQVPLIQTSPETTLGLILTDKQRRAALELSAALLGG